MLSMLTLLYLPLIAANNNGLVEPDGTVVMEVDTDGSPMYHNAPGMTMRDLEIALGITQEDWQRSSVASDALEVDGIDADGTHHIHETHAEVNPSPKFASPLDLDKEDWTLVIDPSKNAVPLGNEKQDFFYSIPYPGPWPPAENGEEAAGKKKAAEEAAEAAKVATTPRPDEDLVVHMRMHSSDEGSKLVKWMQQFMNKTKTAQEGQGTANFREHAHEEPSRFEGFFTDFTQLVQKYFPEGRGTANPGAHMRVH
jgi:hypothetical protein